MATDSAAKTMGKIVLLVLFGFVFGWLFERSHVYEPGNIRLQFVFRKWIMLKMFLGASCGASLSFFFISVHNNELFAAMRSAKLFKGHADNESGSLSTLLLGSSLLGVGMVISGACPGMVLPQVGVGLQNGWATLCGGLAGALMFSIAKSICQRRSSNPIQESVNIASSASSAGNAVLTGDSKALQLQFFDLRFGACIETTRKLLLAFATLCLLFGVALEFLFPYMRELNGPSTRGAWPPFLCGLGIGFINLGTAYTVGLGIGSSTGYETVVAFWRYRSGSTGWKEWYQVPYLLAAIFGAMVSAITVANFPSHAPGIPSSITSFSGGLIMLVGSRLGGGCTSGHGISGMPMLNIYSTLGVVAMFGAGIVLALILDVGFGVLNLQP